MKGLDVVPSGPCFLLLSHWCYLEKGEIGAHLTLLLPASAQGPHGIGSRQPPCHLLPKMLPRAHWLRRREPGQTPAQGPFPPQPALALGPTSTRQTGLQRYRGCVLSTLGRVQQLGELRGPGARTWGWSGRWGANCYKDSADGPRGGQGDHVLSWGTDLPIL